MPGLSRSLKAKVIRRHLVDGPVYGALLMAGATEVSGNGYLRMPIRMASTGNSAVSTETVRWPRATGGPWGELTAMQLFDAPVGGEDLTDPEPLPKPVTILEGDVFECWPGDISVEID